MALPKLRKLDLSFNFVQKDGFLALRALVASRGSSLEELNLSYNVQALRNAGDQGSRHSDLVGQLKRTKDEEKDKLEREKNGKNK